MASNKCLLLVVGLLALAPQLHALDPQPPELLSRHWSTGEPVAPCFVSRMSRNGRFLTMNCFGGGLLPPPSGNADAYVLDLDSREIERISVDSQGATGIHTSVGGVPSEDGRQVAFLSWSQLHPDAPYFGHPDGRPNLFLRRRSQSTTELISRHADGTAAVQTSLLRDAVHQRSEVLIQTDAVLFQSVGTATPYAHLWIRNWDSGEIELVTATEGGGLANGGGTLSSLSSTGRFVVFSSTAMDLSTAARMGDSNIYVRDREAGTVERLTYPWQGGEFQGNFFRVGPSSPRISADGRFVVFNSGSLELHPEADGRVRVYLLDREDETLQLLSQTEHPSYNYGGAISDDGRFVAWTSRTSLFSGPANPSADDRAIWVLDRLTGQRVNVTAPLGPLNEDSSISLDLAGDGSRIAFSWRRSNTSPPEIYDRVYLVELRPSLLAEPAIPIPLFSLPGHLVLWLLLAVTGLVIAGKRYPLRLACNGFGMFISDQRRPGKEG